jgi:GNAT superfamily N-acetyltransferase
VKDLQFSRLSLELQDTFTSPAIDLLYSEVIASQQPTLLQAVNFIGSNDVRAYGLIEAPDRLAAVGTLMEPREVLGEDISEVWVNELAVDRAYRGRGVGRVMLQGLERVAFNELGASTVALYPRNKHGIDVLPFYKHLGYVPRPDDPKTLMKWLKAGDES